MKAVLTILAALVLATGIHSCGNSNAEATKKERFQSSAAIVKTQTVKPVDFAETIKLTGSIESTNDIVVPAEEGGRLVEWLVDKGSSVEPGQVMGRIDATLLKAALDAAEAQFNMADVNFEKQKKAYDEQAISELQLKNLQYQRDAAKAQLDMARQRFEHTKIISPIHGVVNDRYVDEGEMIGPGMPAVHVIDVRSLKILLGVPERYASLVRVGTVIDFSVDPLPGESFSGKIGYVGAAVAVDNRTIPTEVYFSNTGSRIKPNMMARVTLKLSAGSSSIAIPQDFIQQVDIGRHVVYVAKDGHAVERAVQIGGTDGYLVRILEGLNDGDELIVAGFQNLVNAQPISIQN